MYNRNQFLDRNAQDTLANHKREQQERQEMLQREMRRRELEELESQLFYGKQEVSRIKSLMDRLKREAVVRQNASREGSQKFHEEERQLKETNAKIEALDKEVSRTLSEVSGKIQHEKEQIAEHTRVLADLEKKKSEIENKGVQQKRTFSESVSRLLFFLKRDSQEADKAQDLFSRNQEQIRSLQESLKQFTQQTVVLENKIRALRSKGV